MRGEPSPHTERLFQMKKKQQYRNPARDTRIATKEDLLVCILLACVMLLVFMGLAEYTAIANLFSGVLCVMIYLLALTVHAALRLRKDPIVLDNAMIALLTSPLGQLVSRLHEPVMICDEFGNLCWYNEQLAGWISEQGIKLGSSVNSLLDVGEDRRVKLGRRVYSFDAVSTKTDEKTYVFVILTDRTDQVALEERYNDERVAVALVALDNVEEVMQSEHANFRDAIAEVDETLRNWINTIGGIIKSYDNDKYVLFFDSSYLDKFVANRFEILDRVRSKSGENGIPATISMGVARVSGSLSERQAAAQSALDLALQRGGDQVVYKHESGIEYYGGRTKAVYKRTNVKARTTARQLTSMIEKCENVVIMGHSYGDFDSIGACVGMARLAMTCKSPVAVSIAVDTSNPNIRFSIEKALELDDYHTILLSEKEALERIGAQTLLVVVDVNNLDYVEYPSLIKRASAVAIVDHHIQTAEFPTKVKLAYIEPSASSASEMIAEMIEYGVSGAGLRKEEAELLLGGMLLDTKHFTRNTGTRTFAAARYLRAEGADPAEANALFRVEADAFHKESRFMGNVKIYRDSIAISSLEENTDPSYRVVAAQAADKMLTINNVEASFALVKIEGVTYISARSDGTINVQRILERLRGGGHFDVAGAQVEDEEMQSTIAVLRKSIDDFLDKKL